ncbi:MAG: methyltransferase [Desulfobacterales bacterium]
MNRNDWNPGRLLKLSGSYWESCTLHAAVKLDVFSVVSDEHLTSGEIIQKTGGTRRSMETLLNALVAMKLMEKSDNMYSNTEFGERFLSKSSAGYLGHIISHHHHLVESWARLDEAVLEAKPVRSRASFSDDRKRESFLMGMFNLAMAIAPVLVKQVDLSDRSCLLDLGGGPGTYAIHFCLHNPGLKAVVYDLPATRTFAEKIIRQFDLAGRIDFWDGDFLTKGIEGEFDVAWLSHILHGEGPDDCLKILKKTVSALKPGGMILIHEFILDNSMDAPLFPALFSLNMLLGTLNGRAYSEEQLFKMLEDAGAHDARRISFQGPNDSGIVSGVV